MSLTEKNVVHVGVFVVVMLVNGNSYFLCIYSGYTDLFYSHNYGGVYYCSALVFSSGIRY